MIRQAYIHDLEAMVEVDKQVIGHEGRRKEIEESIKHEQCLIAIKDHQVAGFLLFHTSFFECNFISLIIVAPNERRKGYATALIQQFEKMAPTKKVFSSTNESNKTMHQVFRENGYERSGIIENLDEGDPEIVYFKQVAAN
ncbi:GNAT family N-acetyltransferase [Metabacillus iocasae]|uniref:N-acetylglutamate synthase-like GNAT family acetyltransferase n=1 Tax=Priestia iocasae TaxID=2291674 RepID=A0ABS2QX16_9BACI|nr:GNAT family N-acetyltransferase [Metabacillus iocasae]MBM7703497.1 N-acetylglutamate synthase-like GNAT family acetyltransferase [Metabacillus iocasae]